MTEARNRCIAFEHAARQEAALQGVQDGTDASDAGYIERFVRVAVLQERHRAAQTLAGAAAPAPLPPPPPLPPTSERPFYEARAKAAYAKRPPTRGEEPLVDVRGESYRRVLRDSPILAKSDARALARAAAQPSVVLPLLRNAPTRCAAVSTTRASPRSAAASSSCGGSHQFLQESTSGGWRCPAHFWRGSSRRALPQNAEH